MSWSVLTGDYSSSIEAAYIEDLNLSVFNRPIRNLQRNDSIIITNIEKNTQTDTFKTNEITNYNNDNVTIRADKIIIYGDIFQIGETAKINVDELSLADSVITLNTYDLGPGISLLEAGLRIYRDSALFASFIFSETGDSWIASHSGIEAKRMEGGDVSTGYITLDNYDGEDTPGSFQENLYHSKIDDQNFLYLKDVTGTKIVIGQGIGEYNKQITNQNEFENFFGASTLRGTGSTIEGSTYSFIVDSGYSNGTDKFLNNPNGTYDQSGIFMPLRGSSDNPYDGAYILLGGTVDSPTYAWETTSNVQKIGSNITYNGLSNTGSYGDFQIAVPPGGNREWVEVAPDSDNGMHIIYFPKNANDDRDGGYAKLYFDRDAYVNAFQGNFSTLVADQNGSVYSSSINDDNLVVDNEGNLGVAGGGSLRIKGKVSVTLQDSLSLIVKKGEYRLSTEVNLPNKAKIHGQNINNTKIKVANERVKIIADGIEDTNFKDFIIDGSIINTGSAIIKSSQGYSSGNDGELISPNNNYNTSSIFVPVNANSNFVFYFGENRWQTDADAGSYISASGVGASQSGVYGDLRLSPDGNNWDSFASSVYNGLYSVPMPRYYHEDKEGGYWNYYYDKSYWSTAFGGGSDSILIAQNGSVYRSSINPENLVNTWDGKIGSAIASTLESALIEQLFRNTQTYIFRDTSGLYSPTYENLHEIKNSKNLVLKNNITGFSEKIIYSEENSERNQYGNVFYNSSISFKDCNLSYHFGRYSSNIRNFLECRGFIQGFMNDAPNADGSNLAYGHGDLNF